MATGAKEIGAIKASLTLETGKFSESLTRAKRDMQTTAAEAKQAGDKVDDMGKSFDKSGKSAVSASANITKLGVAYGALATAMTVVINKAVQTAATFESSMARVQAMSSATADEFKRLEDQAISLGASTVFSSSQVAEGQAFLAIAGFKANDIIAAMPGLLDLAAAAQMDLGRAADITSNILTGFRLEAEQTSRVSDVLAKAFTSSNTSMEQLGYAMRYAAPIAASLGMSIEETAAAIGILSNAGIQGEMAGTQLRAMLLRLVNPVGDAEKVIEQLGIKTQDAMGNILPFSDILRQLQTAMSGLTQSAQAEAAALIAGTEAASGFLTLISTGADELERFTGVLEDSGGTAQQIAEIQMDTYNGALEEMRSALEGVGITVGNDFKPAMRAAAEEVTRMLLGFNELDSGTRTFIITMATASTGVGVLITGIYGMITALKALRVAGIAANAALGWIGALSLVIGGVAAAFVSYKVEAEAAAEAQRNFNEELAKSPFERTQEDVLSLQDTVTEINDLLEKHREIRAKIDALPSMAAAYGMSEEVRKVTDEHRKLGEQIEEVNRQLAVFGIDTPDDAPRVLEELNRQINASLPALRELRMAELEDIAAKQDQAAESEKLLDRYRELASQTERTADENEELTRTVRQLSERYPDLATELDAQGTLLIANEGLIRDIITAEQDALAARLQAERDKTQSLRRETAEALDAAKKQITALQSIASAETPSQPWMSSEVSSFIGGMASRAAQPILPEALGKAQKEVDHYQRLLNELDTELLAIENGTWRGLFGDGAGGSGGLSAGTGTLGLGGGGGNGKSSGGNAKATKSAEQLAQESYRTSLQWLEKRRLLGELTEEQEATALERLAERYKKYDDIWIDAEGRRQRVVEQMAAAAARSAEERARQSEAAQRASYEKSAEWIEMETRRMMERGESEREITEMQLEAWTRVRNRYDKDTEHYKRADKAMYDARMSLRRMDERDAAEVATANEKRQRDLTKSVLDNIDKQRQAQLAALDEQKRAVQQYYDDLLRIIDESERGRERKKIEEEAEKYRYATSEKGRKRYEELQEQLRKMDVEDNRAALRQERDDKLAALDRQKRDIDAWYADLKSAAESFNGDMISLYQLTEDARLKAFVETNAEIKAEMERFQAEMAAITSSNTAASSYDPYRSSVIAQMSANSKAWHTADGAGKARLASENQRLGAEIGASYDSLLGRWLDASGLPLFHTGGIVGSRKFNAGDMLMPDEITAILREGEVVLTPQQISSLVGGMDRRAGTNVTIEKVVGVEMNDTILEDEIDVRAIGRTGVDMATEMARRSFTGGV